MEGRKEHLGCIKFCVKLGKTFTKTFDMMTEAFGEECLSRTQVFEWHIKFASGRISIEGNESSGHSTTSTTSTNIEKIHVLIYENHQRMIHELAAIVGISFGSCQATMMEMLPMCQIAAKFVPWLLSKDQEENHLQVCLEFKGKCMQDPTFLSRIITGEESWIYGYDPETKQQSSQWKSSRSPIRKKAHHVQTSTQSMLIIFFDIRGIVHCEFVPGIASNGLS